MRSRAKGPVTRRTAWALAVMLIGGAALPVPPIAADQVGRPLAEALNELQRRGLEIFFTSQLVRPEMRVLEEPTSEEPRQRLEQLLAPHGLTAVDGPGGRLVVVEAEARPTGVRGQVRVRRSAVAVPGVRILVPGTQIAVLSDADGRYEILDLEPGRLAVEAHLPGYVVEQRSVEVLPRQVLAVDFQMAPAPLALDEIVITPSRISLLQDEPTSALNLDRDDIFTLPHLGDDIFRAFTLMPGVTGEEPSARFNVRGGRSDEVLVLLDKVELFEPYHLKDYGSALSIVTPRALREVNLITGGFPAEYGDRMSGVLDMSTEQVDESRTHLGLSVLTAEIGHSGTFAGQRGHWLTSLRRGQLDLTLDFLGQRQKPRYWDGFGKLHYQIGQNQRLGFHLLLSDDSLDFFNIDPDNVEDYLTNYGNSYVWFTHQHILSPRLFVDSVASFGKVDRDRRATELDLEEDPDEGGEDGEGEGEAGEEEPEPEFEPGFELIDLRDLEATGVKQDWSFQASDRQYLKWGFDVRRLVTDYDYFNRRTPLDELLEEIRFEPVNGVTRFQTRLRGKQYSLYLSDRLRPASDLTLELGLRYDEHTQTDDRHLSPRFNLVYALGQASTLRAAWGYFYQSQRPYELQIEDGVTTLFTAERTEQRVLGFEHHFAGGSGRDWLLRVEAYQREIRNPRSRYENLYQPVEVFPEIEPDRVLIAPQSGRSQGVELFVRGSLTPRIDWWASYTYSETEDRLDGVWVPRRFDQPHAVNLDFNFQVGKHWNLNLAFRYHTGWPVTPLSGRLEEDDEGELEPVLVIGPFYTARLPDYHRLDLRTSREWQRKKGVLGFFVEVQNLYDRQNVAGFDPDFELEVADDGTVSVVADEEFWGRFLPSFGITWDF